MPFTHAVTTINTVEAEEQAAKGSDMGSEDNESQLFQSSSSRDVDLSNEWEQDTTAIKVGAIIFQYCFCTVRLTTCAALVYAERGRVRAPEVKILSFVGPIGTCDLYKP